MISRTEHPKPQFMRDNWVNLNGKWDFVSDPGNSGKERGLQNENAVYDKTINVPFCPQSSLSGICDTDFMNSVWYRREFFLDSRQTSEIVRLHFGAVDYDAEIFINGQLAGSHRGGYVSFYVDIEKYVVTGKNTVTVHASDSERDRMIPSGKQSSKYGSYGCFYTRTTGIWQTVWLEFIPKTHIEKFRVYPSAEDQSVTIVAQLKGCSSLSVSTAFDGNETGSVTVDCEEGACTATIGLSEKHLWEIGNGRLYDLTLRYGNDMVKSYFGLRSISYRDKKFYLNGKSVFQRLVLDQGFYPDGIYTAPSDNELKGDIERSVAMGFNGARLHQKVFEERFLYHADKLGYIVWGEYPNWGLDHSYADSVYGILPEWLEEVERDFNHPSIVGWCPFNETWDENGRKQYDALLSLVYKATKSADPTRPCIDTSGNFHVITDIYDIHDYEQDPEIFRQSYEKLPVDGTYKERFSNRQLYDGEKPFFVSEYGGTRWSDKDGWGYGQGPKNEEEFISRVKGLTDTLLDNPAIFAFCYTQLTDVEQEQNGLYTYERKAKFSPEIISAIFSRKAAVEE